MVDCENGPRSVPDVAASTPKNCTVSAPFLHRFSKQQWSIFPKQPSGTDAKIDAKSGTARTDSSLSLAQFTMRNWTPPEPVQKWRSFGSRQNCGREATGSPMELNRHTSSPARIRASIQAKIKISKSRSAFPTGKDSESCSGRRHSTAMSQPGPSSAAPPRDE